MEMSNKVKSDIEDVVQKSAFAKVVETLNKAGVAMFGDDGRILPKESKNSEVNPGQTFKPGATPGKQSTTKVQK